MSGSNRPTPMRMEDSAQITPCGLTCTYSAHLCPPLDRDLVSTSTSSTLKRIRRRMEIRERRKWGERVRKGWKEEGKEGERVRGRMERGRKCKRGEDEIKDEKVKVGKKEGRLARIIIPYLFSSIRNDAAHLFWLLGFVEIVDLQTRVKGERDNDLKDGQEVTKRRGTGIR